MVLPVGVNVGAQEPARSCPSCFVSGAKTGIHVESTGGGELPPQFLFQNCVNLHEVS